jgi:opacity protein-like surface antigen
MRLPCLATALAFATLAAAVGPVGAAEPAEPAEEPPVLEHTADIMPDVAATGFYVRGDAGAAVFRDPRVALDDPRARLGRFRDAAIDVTGTVGLGAGLKATEWLRGDVTVDYTPEARFSARTRCARCTPTRTQERAAVATLAVLLNGYVDFGSLGPVTPYVGGGVGGAAVWIDGFRFRGPTARGGRADASDVVFAWSLAGGAAIELTPTASLDLGYRYLGLGSTETGRVAVGTGRSRIAFSDLGQHQVRLGLRFGIW